MGTAVETLHTSDRASFETVISPRTDPPPPGPRPSSRRVVPPAFPSDDPIRMATFLPPLPVPMLAVGSRNTVVAISRRFAELYSPSLLGRKVETFLSDPAVLDRVRTAGPEGTLLFRTSVRVDESDRPVTLHAGCRLVDAEPVVFFLLEPTGADAGPDSRPESDDGRTVCAADPVPSCR